MNHDEILARLKKGEAFSGRNGCFTGTMKVTAVKGDGSLVVDCEKDGYHHEETWDDDIRYTLYAFEDGDYFFL